MIWLEYGRIIVTTQFISYLKALSAIRILSLGLKLILNFTGENGVILSLYQLIVNFYKTFYFLFTTLPLISGSFKIIIRSIVLPLEFGLPTLEKSLV
jgi:hypothetical protein